MAYLTYVVLTVCCWTAKGATVNSRSQADHSHGKEEKERVSMAVNAHGPMQIQDPSAPDSENKFTRTFSKAANKMRRDRREPSYMQKSTRDDPTVTVFSDADCREKEFKLELKSGKDWTSSCYMVGLQTTGGDIRLKTDAPDKSSSNKSSLMQSRKVWGHPAEVQMKLVCEDNGAVVIYNANDDGCEMHASRFVLDKDQAYLARSGKCLTGTAEIHDKDEGSISMQFRDVDDGTVFPECFKESTIPLPDGLVAFVGPENALYVIIGCSVGGFLLLSLMLCWCWKKCAPGKEEDAWGEGESAWMKGGKGKGKW